MSVERMAGWMGIGARAFRLALGAAAVLLAPGVGRAELRDLFAERGGTVADGGWHVSVDSLFLARADDMSTVLIRDAAVAGSPSVFHTGQLDLGVSAGPMINVVRDLGDNWGVGVRYFGLDSFGDSHSQVFQPGQSFQEAFGGLNNTDMDQFDIAYASRLYNVELNLRHDLNERWTVFAGYRFVELDEAFGAYGRTVVNETPPADQFQTRTSNQLHGVQLGLQGMVLELNRFQLQAGGSAGLYGNHVTQTVRGATNEDVITPPSTRSDEAAFLGDINVTGIWRLNSHVSLRAGVQLLYLSGIALGPDQTQNNNIVTGQYAIDNESFAFYYGGFAGLQIDF